MNANDIIKYMQSAMAADPLLASIDTSETSNFYDVNLRPMGLLGSIFTNYSEQIDLRNNLANVQTMDRERLALHASNFFTYFPTVNRVFATVQIVLDGSVNDDLHLSESTHKFTTSDGIEFHPTQDYSFYMQTIDAALVGGVLKRIVSVPVISTNATRKVGINEITNTNIVHPALILVTNESVASDPILPPTTDQMMVQMQSASGKMLYSPKAIASAFLEVGISDTQVIGYGDPEMQRDISIQSEAFSCHVGGKIDAYVRTQASRVEHTAHATRVGNQPVYRFILARYIGAVDMSEDLHEIDLVANPNVLIGANTLPTLPFMFPDPLFTSLTSLSNPEVDFISHRDIEVDPKTNVHKIEIHPLENTENLRGSKFEQLEVLIHCKRDIGELCRVIFSYYAAPEISALQNYVDVSPFVLKGSTPLVKSFHPVEVQKLVITYDKNFSFDEAATKVALCSKINSWSSGNSISLSELLRLVPAPVRLAEVGAGFSGDESDVTPDSTSSILPSLLQNYDGPAFAEMKQILPNGTVKHFYSTKQISGIEAPELSVSHRTMRFYIANENIEFRKG